MQLTPKLKLHLIHHLSLSLLILQPIVQIPIKINKNQPNNISQIIQIPLQLLQLHLSTTFYTILLKDLLHLIKMRIYFQMEYLFRLFSHFLTFIFDILLVLPIVFVSHFVSVIVVVISWNIAFCVLIFELEIVVLAEVAH